MSLSEYQPAFLSLEQQGDAVVARVMRSQLSEEDNIQQMAQELITLIDHYQCQQLALSLGEVAYMTSAALGKLIMIHRKLHRKAGRLVMCDITAGVADILRTSRLDEYFTIASDTSHAVLMLAAS